MTGFSCFRSGIVHCNPWKAPVAPFTPISCQSRERSELIFTERTAIPLPDGRRRKKCSAMYPSLRGCYLSVLWFKGSKQCLRHPFMISGNGLWRSVIHKAGIYSFLYFLFFLYSRNYKQLNIKTKKTQRSSRIYRWSSRIYKFPGKGLAEFTDTHCSKEKV